MKEPLRKNVDEELQECGAALGFKDDAQGEGFVAKSERLSPWMLVSAS
jgi:hypothetical protein